MPADTPLLRFYLEPREPIEVSELTGAMSALAHQYQSFAQHEGLAGKAADARLLVSSVSQGSIDILFQPEVLLAGTAMLPLIEKAQIVLKFAKRIKAVIDFFQKKDSSLKDSISARDCDDVTAILRPTAHHGGIQTFTTINGPVTQNILSIDGADAMKVIEAAVAYKATLRGPEPERRESVSLTWKRLDKDQITTSGSHSPDKAIIAEIDNKPHAVLFTDLMSPIKKAMIDDEQNPYKKVFFVDVEISRVESGKISAYRIVGYHGKDELAD